MDKDTERFVDAAAALVGVKIEPEIRVAVTANFDLFRGLIARIEGFEEPETPEPPARFAP